MASAGRCISHQACQWPGASQPEIASARSCSSFSTGAGCYVTSQQLRDSSWWSYPHAALSNRCAGIAPCLFFLFSCFFPLLAAFMQACAHCHLLVCLLLVQSVWLLCSSFLALVCSWFSDIAACDASSLLFLFSSALLASSKFMAASCLLATRNNKYQLLTAASVWCNDSAGTAFCKISWPYDTTHCKPTVICGLQPKMRAKFKVSFQSRDRLDAHHSSGDTSDDSEGLQLP